MSIVKKRLQAYAVIILGLAMAVNLIKDIVRLNRAGDRLAAAEADLSEAIGEQAGLKRQLESAKSEFQTESRIRNILKMAKPEEIIVVVPEEVTARVEKAGQAVEAEEEENNLGRWRQVFGF